MVIQEVQSRPFKNKTNSLLFFFFFFFAQRPHRPDGEEVGEADGAHVPPLARWPHGAAGARGLELARAARNAPVLLGTERRQAIFFFFLKMGRAHA